MTSLQEAFQAFALESQHLKTAYEALQKQFAERNKTLTLLFDHLEVGVLFVSLEGILLHANPQACHIAKTALKGPTPFASLFADDVFGFSMREALAKEHFDRKVILHLGEKEVKITAHLIVGEGIVCTLEDREEIKKLEKVAARNERLQELGQMAATLAHEIRNPLGGIEGFAALLRRDVAHDPHLTSMTEKILEGTQHLNRLVTNILNHARPLDVHLSRLHLVPLIEEVLAFVKHDFPALAFDFIPKENPSLWIDKDLFRMALLNVVRNAAEASLPGQKVEVTLGVREEHLFVAVRDEGKGIAKQHLPLLFTPFFTTKAKGTGLGLVEAHKAITALGGSLEVVSQEGLGALFTLTWSRT